MLRNNFSVLMAERDLKIADVYEQTGISKTTLTAIAENSGKGVQYETVDKLCNFLNVGPDRFFIYAPYVTRFEFTGNSQSLFNYHMKNGKRDYYYPVNVNFLNGDSDEALFAKRGVDLELFKGYHVITVEVLKTMIESFDSVYLDLPVQFQKVVRKELCENVIHVVNDLDVLANQNTSEQLMGAIKKFREELGATPGKILFVLDLDIDGSLEYVKKSVVANKGKYKFI